MLRLCMSTALALMAALPATQAGAGSTFEGAVFKGSAIFGVDNKPLAEFLDANTLEIVYLAIGVGYDVNGEEARKLEEECKTYQDNEGKEVEILGTGTPIYVALTNSALGELGCGDLIELDLSKAAIGASGGGTGLSVFGVRGIFQVSQPGRWNDMHRTFQLRGLEASYEVLQDAQTKAAALPEQ
jgi:hypothetical protein